MSKKFTLDTLTEGIRQRNMGERNRHLSEKWTRTGLLRGLEGVHRENMAQLLENQAGQILREQNTLGGGGLAPAAASGDIRGFTNVAFPIVRRVFGGLVANELVSIQPMSLPSGLLFYLDYTYGTDVGGADDGIGDSTHSTYDSGQSIYNNPAGKGIRSGSLGVGGQYDLAGSGYSRVHTGSAVTLVAANIFALGGDSAQSRSATTTVATAAVSSGSDGRFLQFDPQVIQEIDDENGRFAFVTIPLRSTGGPLAKLDLTLIKEAALFLTGASGSGNADWAVPGETWQGGKGVYNIRRLNQLVTSASSGGSITAAPMANFGDTGAALLMVLSGTAAASGGGNSGLADFRVTYPKAASLSSTANTADTLVVPVFESNFGTGTPLPQIPEIDIKIEAISVVANTRKLRARWSPELAQDLNAYHSLDAEVELTQILSEQIALEIDREILNDLLMQADTNYYWSRAPGVFVNKKSGAAQTRTDTLSPGPAFTGTVREWYETLVETVIDVANEIHRKTLRGSANFMVVSPDVATILEASVLYKPVYSIDGDGQVGAPMQLGAEKVGTLSNRFTVYKDPYFPRNKVLVGYKGGSYLETGYVYAPYVPLIVTPTIFAPEDFTPRKGVMTRYGKKMVRNDFYGTVTCMDMDVI
tara:strand:+ start:2294 stop:4225 length:1932 start_codon:yes stop_codon:yes gene_type:complete